MTIREIKKVTYNGPAVGENPWACSICGNTIKKNNRLVVAKKADGTPSDIIFCMTCVMKIEKVGAS